MNKQQLIEALKSKGFHAEEYEDGVVASLNRNMDTIEIKMAIPEIEDHQLFKVAHNAIGIICME